MARQKVPVAGVYGSLSIWKIVAGLCLGLGIAAGVYLLSGGYHAAGEASDFVSAPPIIAANSKANTTKEDVGPSTLFAPATAPTKLIKQAATAESELPARPIRETVLERDTILIEKSAIRSGSGHDFSSGQTGNIINIEPDPELSAQLEQTKVTNVKQPTVSASVSTLSSVELTAVQSIYVDSITNARISEATQILLNPAKIITRRPVQLGRWEVGLHVTPWVSGSKTDVYTLTGQSNGFSPNQYNFGNRTVNLYPEDNFRQVIPRCFQVKVVSFELARQFSNGLRAGIGLFWMPPNVDGRVDQGQILNDQLSDESTTPMYTGVFTVAYSWITPSTVGVACSLTRA